jgi:hypothetical protein
MLTFFAIPKPFVGHIGIIQRNALSSWVRLHPACEVIVFGDEPGTAEIARDLGIRHEPELRRNEFGTPLLGSVFARAQQIATHDLLCYVNSDIVLLPDFSETVARVGAWSPQFLMVGRRRDVPVTEPIDFHRHDWEPQLREFTMNSGKQQLPYAVDYFVFPSKLYGDVPPLAIGRGYWDHWLVWKARSLKVPVVDASADVLAIHQNHGHLHPEGFKGLIAGTEGKRNRALAGGQWHLYTIEHATYRLVGGQIQDKPGRWHVPLTFFVRTYASQFWYGVLKRTFELRRALGLRRASLSNLQQRVRSLLDG